MVYRSMNMLFSFRIFVASLLLLVAVVACKSTDSIKTNTSTSDKSDLEALYWARVDSSRMSFTDADVNFMMGMIGHHAQALIMSELAFQNSDSEQVQRLAARIINSQQDEISSMQQWLRDREQPVPEIQIKGLNLVINIADNPYTAYKKMPGVLSQEQLQELDSIQGSDFDRLFLKYMIEHHSGAVNMVKNLFSTDGAAQDREAFRLASGIQVDQITEIERMNLMLDKLSKSGKQS